MAVEVGYPGNWIHSTLRCHLFLLEGYKMDQLPDVKEVLKELYENSRPFKEIKKFSDSPGIYGVFFYGSEFPLKDL